MFTALERRVRILEKQLKTLKRIAKEDKLAVESIFLKYFGKDFRKEADFIRDGCGNGRSSSGKNRNKRQLALVMKEPESDHEQDSPVIKRTCVRAKSRSESERPSVDLESLEHSVRIEDSIIVFDYHHGEPCEDSSGNFRMDKDVVDVCDSRDSPHESQANGNRSSRDASTSMSFGFGSYSSIENSPAVQVHATDYQIQSRIGEENNPGPDNDSQPSTSSSSTNFESEGDSGPKLGISQKSREDQGLSSKEVGNTPPDIIADISNSSDPNQILLSQGSSDKSRVLVRSIHVPSHQRRGSSKSPLPMYLRERWLLSSKRSGHGNIVSKNQGEGSKSNNLSLIIGESSPEDVALSQNNNDSIQIISREIPIPNTNNSPNSLQCAQTSPGQELNHPENPDSIQKEIISSTEIQIIQTTSNHTPKSIPAELSSSNILGKEHPVPSTSTTNNKPNINAPKLSVRQRKKLRKLQKVHKIARQGLRRARAFVDNDGDKSYLSRPKIITIDSGSSPEALPFLPLRKDSISTKAKPVTAVGPETITPNAPPSPENAPNISNSEIISSKSTGDNESTPNKV